MKSNVIIFTDGASKGNPGHGGWGAIVIFPERKNDKNNELGIMNYEVRELGGKEEHTTNNRMELCAAIEALSFLKHSVPNAGSSTLIVYSDSSYVVTGITKWILGWKKKGWITTQKEEVLNKDLWEKLSDLSDNFVIEWKRVAGHADTLGNARCDEIATAFAKVEHPRLFSGPRSDYAINVDVIGRTEGVRQGGTVYSYVSCVDGVVKTNKTWKECEARVKGRKAKYKKVFSREEEEQVSKEFARS